MVVSVSPQAVPTYMAGTGSVKYSHLITWNSLKHGLLSSVNALQATRGLHWPQQKERLTGTLYVRVVDAPRHKPCQPARPQLEAKTA